MEVTVEIDVDDELLGEWLVCDDPEGHPMTSGAFLVQAAIQEKLGWTNEISERLWKESGYMYAKWVKLAKEWAKERLKNL